jgi:hypothetical protein
MGSLSRKRRDGIVVDTLARAVARVQQLKPQFPAAIWEIWKTA